jgi:TIR domain-containing protein
MPNTPPPMPVDIFFSFAHEDEELMDHVRRQLVVFERQGRIVKWHDRRIPAGVEWEPTIDERLRHCHIILLFVSPDFLDSRYCWDVEVKLALERHERKEARVIPIILRPCAWHVAPFAKLQALPKDGRPLSQWPDRDQTCLDVALSIISVADELTHRRTASHTSNPSPTLSDTAAELLHEAAADPDGQIRVVKYDGGSSLIANRRDFTGRRPREEVASWEAALQELTHKGLVRDAGGHGRRFVVTHAGFKIAGPRLQNEGSKG